MPTDPAPDLASPPAGGSSQRAEATTRTARVDEWLALQRSFAFALASHDGAPAWLERFTKTAIRVREMTAQDADTALCMMLQTATHELEQYSARHALFCGVIADLCAVQAGWPDDEARPLFHAALTMNIGMRAVPDEMARQPGPLSDAQRVLIDGHPKAGVELLQTAGVADALWLEIVRRHHRPVDDGETSEPPSTPQRLAQLLHRIDVFTAKLSRRRTRPGSTATVAARDACLDASGLPDATGAVLLRVLGLYPPGSFVRLASGEIGIVIRRGEKAHTPQVACVRSFDGSLVANPMLRDTARAGHAIQRSLAPDEVRMRLDHAKVVGAT